MRDGFQSEQSTSKDSEMEQSVTEIPLTIPCYDATDKTEQYREPEPQKWNG